MGAAVSRAKQNSNKNDSSGSVLRAAQDITKLSYDQMELEFNQIHKRSQERLRLCSGDPCQNLSVCIVLCLNKHKMQMIQCFETMDDYRACVHEEMSKKLSKIVQEYDRKNRNSVKGKDAKKAAKKGSLKDENPECTCTN